MGLIALLRIDGIVVIFGLLFLLLFVFVISALIIAAVRAGRRQKALERFAGEMGFSYARAADFPAFLRTGRFDLFSKGHRFTDKVKNMLRGQLNGAEVLIFDYYYRETTQVSHITQTTRVTVACFRNPESNQPFIYHQAGFNYLAPDKFRSFLEDGMKAFKQSGVT